MEKLSAFIKILRPINFIITFLSVVVAGLICSEIKVITMPIILAALSASLVGSAGNIINDYFDIEIDSVNRPERVLPSGIISPKISLFYYLFLVAASILLAVQINYYAILIVLIANISIFLYSFKFKSIPLLGNFTVAFFTGLAFIYGGIAVGNWGSGIFPALFAFLINLIREIVKDIEDIEGDSKAGIKTFPIVYGKEKSFRLILFLGVILIITTFIPFYMSIYNIEYLILVLFTVNVTLVYLLKKLLSSKTKKDFRYISSLLKLDMVFGLISIYIGTL